MLPTKIEMTNFKSFNHVIINFDFSSALIVGEKGGDSRKSNGAGKTSLLQGIAFALFGETSDKNSNDVVRRGQAACEVILWFSHEDRNFRIKRTRIAKYSKMTTEFCEILSDGTEISKTGDTNKLTDANIQSVIRCSYDTFINSSYFQQNSFFQFAQGTFATRQSLMGSLLNIDRWNKYQKMAKERFDEASTAIVALKNDLERTAGADIKLIDTREKLATFMQETATLQTSNEVIEDEITDLERRIASNGAIMKDVYRFNTLTTSLSSDRIRLERTQADIENKQRLCDEAQFILTKNALTMMGLDSEIDIIKEKARISNVSELKASIIKMEAAIMDGKSKQRTLALQIENLQNNDICNLCGHEWTDDNAKHNACTEKVAEKVIVEGKLERAGAKLAAVKSELDGVRANELELEKIAARRSGIVNSNTANKYKVETLTQEIAVAEQVVEQLVSKIFETEAALAELEHVSKLDTSNSPEALLADKKRAHKKNGERLAEIAFHKGSLTKAEQDLVATIAESSVVLNKIAEQNKLCAVYGKLTKAFGRDGVQAIMIDNVIEELTRIANEWLFDFCDEPTYVHFITQKQSTKGDWKETLDIEITTPTGVSKFESLSGGEQFRVSFAIRLALSALQARRMGGETQVLLLDEVSTSLDPAGLDMFVSIIRKLERTLKVMVITHDDNLKEAFDTIITVSKTANGTEVKDV